LGTDKAVAMDVHNGRVSLLGNRTSNNALFHYREMSSLINQPPQCLLQNMSYSRKIYGNAALTTSESIISHTINYPQLNWCFTIGSHPPRSKAPLYATNNAAAQLLYSPYKNNL
jgi:hypothetical protein